MEVSVHHRIGLEYTGLVLMTNRKLIMILLLNAEKTGLVKMGRLILAFNEGTFGEVNQHIYNIRPMAKNVTLIHIAMEGINEN